MLDVIRRAKEEKNVDLLEILGRVEKSFEEIEFIKQLQESHPTIEQFFLEHKEFSNILSLSNLASKAQLALFRLAALKELIRMHMRKLL